MSDIKYQEVKKVLLSIESEMQRVGLWSAGAPSPEAFLSDQPFSYDTMTLIEWVQFVFLKKMKELIENDMPLPSRCGISPMAEEYFKGLSVDSSRLLALFGEVDVILGGLAEN